MYIDTDHGLIPLEAAREGMSIATPDGPRPITAVRRSDGASWHRLELSNGIALEVPSWRRLRSRGEWIAADQLSTDMPVYLPMRRGLFGRETALHLEYRSHRSNPRAPTLPRAWTVELAEFVGYFAGRGYFLEAAGRSQRTSSAIVCAEPDLLEHMSKAAVSAFGRRPTRETGTPSTPALFFHSADFCGFMEQLLIDEDGTWRMPTSMARAPEPIVSAFLRGFFEARGDAAYPKGITTTCSHRALLADVQQLLTLYGIASTVRPYHTAADGRTRFDYVITLHGNHARAAFSTSIGFISELRRRHLATYLERDDLRDQFSLAMPDSFSIERHIDHFRARRAADPRIDAGFMSLLYAMRRTGGIRFSPARLAIIADALEDAPLRDAQWKSDRAFCREAVGGAYFEVTVRSSAPVDPRETIALSVEGGAYLLGGIVVGDDVEHAPFAAPRIVVREQRVPTTYVSAGTLVDTDRGTVPIESVQPGERIATAMGARVVEARTDVQEMPAVTLTLNARTLTCSPTSLVRSAGVWREAGSLSPGSPMYSSLREGLFGSETNLYLHFTADHPISHRSTIRLPSRLDVELAELLGYISAHGAGSSDKSGRIERIRLYADLEDEDVAQHFVGILRRQFNKEVGLKRRKIIHIEVLSLDIGGAIEQLGFGRSADTRRVPPAIWRAPREIAAAFLRGFLERKLRFAPGGPGRRADDLTIACAGRALALDLRRLLARFGVGTSLSESPPVRDRVRFAYMLRVTPTISKKRLVERIGLISERQRSRAQGIIAGLDGYDSNLAGHGDSITVGAGCDLERLRDEIYRYRRTPELDDAERERLADIATRLSVMLGTVRDRLTARRAAVLVNALPEALIDEFAPFLREIVDGQYLEFAVESIEPTVAATVGLVVEGGQYLAEELVVGG